jgi:hypothetical protein
MIIIYRRNDLDNYKQTIFDDYLRKLLEQEQVLGIEWTKQELMTVYRFPKPAEIDGRMVIPIGNVKFAKAHYNINVYVDDEKYVFYAIEFRLKPLRIVYENSKIKFTTSFLASSEKTVIIAGPLAFQMQIQGGCFVDAKSIVWEVISIQKVKEI